MTSAVMFVVARARNGVIGKNGRLPWHIPADLRHFKQLTMGLPMIMGRKTFGSFPAPLPGRRHIVLTRDPDWRSAGAEIARTPAEALDLAGDGRVAVIGGAEIFNLFLNDADVIELTEVHCDVEGDTAMPGFDPAQWKEVGREDHAGDKDIPPFSFVRLERRQV